MENHHHRHNNTALPSTWQVHASLPWSDADWPRARRHAYQRKLREQQGVAQQYAEKVGLTSHDHHDVTGDLQGLQTTKV